MTTAKLVKSRRSLQTILFTDIVGSTERAAELGDRAWRELLQRHHAAVRQTMRRWGAREVNEAGDGFLAILASPARGIACAAAIRDAVQALGLEVRCGVHMGEIEHTPDASVGGIGVHIGARVAALAAPGEILVSRAVRDAEEGSGFVFEDRGAFTLKGIQGERRLFRVSALPGQAPGLAPGRGERVALALRGRPRRMVAVGAVALVLLAGVPLFYRAFRETGRPTPGEAMAEAAAPGIAVLPFQATGPGLDIWREGMIDLLSTDLDGAGGLRAIDSRTVLARWGETVPAGAVADLATSLEAARKTGARWAVVGAAVGLGSQVRLTADVYELESGRNLGQAEVQGAPDSVYMLVDRLAIDVLRTVLGPRRRDLPRVELAHVTTSSLPALKAYLEGELLYRRADIPAAIEAYQRAVEADTTFALAYMRLAQTIGWLPPEIRPEKGLDYYDQRAVRYADRLPEREAILVRTQWAFYQASLAMLEPLRQATRRFPDDPELWYLLADHYFDFGDQILLPDDEVRRAFDRLLALDPTFALFYNAPIVDAFQRADSARTLDLLTRYERLVKRDEPRLLGHRLAYELAWGGPERRARALAAADTMDPLHLHVGELFHPRFLAEAEALARIGRPTRPGWYMFVALLRGRNETALSTLSEPNLPPAVAAWTVYTLRDHGAPVDERFRRAIPLSVTDSTGQEGFWIAAVAAEEERWETHRRAVGRVSALADSFRSRGDTLDETKVRAIARALDAYATWRRGDRETALHELTAAQKEANYDFRSLVNATIRWWIVRLLQGLDRPRETEPWLLSLDLDPYAHLELGRLYERLGRRDEARERYELFVTAWRDADPELQPIVEEARQAMIRLRGIRRE